jgi:hypothetical protein
MTLGIHMKRFDRYAESIDQLSVQPWFSGSHNMAMAINWDTFLSIQNCSHVNETIIIK